MDWLDKIITPRVAVCAIVESVDRNYITMIKRKYPPLGLAFPGGFMEVDETIEETATREVKEETNLDICDGKLLDVTSGRNLDIRSHFVVISTVFRATSCIEPTPGDDALEAFWINWIDVGKIWDQLTERAKLEYDEYTRWRCFNQNGEKWVLSNLK